MNRLLDHARANVVAYLALFVALGGSSYAAFELPNHSIDPVKLNPRTIGRIRARVGQRQRHRPSDRLRWRGTRPRGQRRGTRALHHRLEPAAYDVV